MSRYQPYPEYKDSGVEWIGRVPEHWKVKPICRVTSVNDDTLPDSTSGATIIRYVDISSVGFMEGIKQATEMSFTDAPSRARRKASSGDVIVSTVRTYLKAVAAVTDEYADCVFSTGFAILRASQLEQSFLKWMILNELLVQAIEAHSEGLSYPAINASALVKLKSAIPPREEQTTIATTLDRETTRIDTLVEKKQRFIELLEEKRQAVITQAVTKGLDPNVPMKDSGVEWIGEVPVHWGAEKVGNLFAELNDRGGSKDQLLAVSQEHGVLPQAEYAATVDRRLSQSQSGDYSNYKSVEPRSFVYNKMRMWQGAIGLSRYSGCVSPAYVTFRALHPVDESFYFGVFRTGGFVSEVNRLSQGICDDQNSCSFGDFRTIFVPSPPHREQSQIATFLDRETTRIDTLIEKTRDSIELLKERRSALITAAVTGKIDVREEAA